MLCKGEAVIDREVTFDTVVFTTANAGFVAIVGNKAGTGFTGGFIVTSNVVIFISFEVVTSASFEVVGGIADFEVVVEIGISIVVFLTIAVVVAGCAIVTMTTGFEVVATVADFCVDVVKLITGFGKLVVELEVIFGSLEVVVILDCDKTDDVSAINDEFVSKQNF